MSHDTESQLYNCRPETYGILAVFDKTNQFLGFYPAIAEYLEPVSLERSDKWWRIYPYGCNTFAEAAKFRLNKIDLSKPQVNNINRKTVDELIKQLTYIRDAYGV